MEILVISHKYPPSIGGMQTHCFKLVEELKKGNNVHEIIWKSNYPRILFFLMVNFRALWILKSNQNIKLIYLNDGLMSLICTPLLWLTNKPLIATIHGLDINFPSKFYQAWARKYLNRFSRIIAVSEPTRKLCIEKGILQEKVILVENAVDITFKEENYDPDFIRELSKEINFDLNNKFIVTSLGRAIPRKGFNWFVRNVLPECNDDLVYIVLARKFPEERLFKIIKKITTEKLFEKIRLLVGAEIDATAIHQSSIELGLEKKVIHLSQFTDSRSKIFKIIKHSHLFIMPNIKIQGDYEGFGLVALEAASQGTLTLASNVDGIPSAVKHNENGILVSAGDKNAWKETIEKYQNNRELLSEKALLFQKNTVSVSRSWKTMSEGYLQVFSQSE